MRDNRHILLLQGPASWFFAALGLALRQQGALVTRMVFCPGDRLFWRRKSGQVLPYRGPRDDYAAFLALALEQRKITDIICLGDGRFWHAKAVELCHGLPDPPRIHIVEHGYYRPGWLTLERDGINANSRFSPGISAEKPAPPQKFKSSFLNYALMDIGWNLANVLFARFRYPHFKTHSLVHPVQEWRGWIGKALRKPFVRLSTAKANRRIMDHRGPVFVFPLQLDGDYQIRVHGPKAGLCSTVRDVCRSFANHAPKDALLVFKVHPLDNGRINWQKVISKTNCPRCIFLNGGDLDMLLDKAAAVVTINSTVGLQSIDRGIPSFVIGKAIYRIKGLCSHDDLDGFWNNPQPPDAQLAQQFRDSLIAKTQISGAFDGTGVKAGAKNIAKRILAAG
ncbi:MAG: capsular biosynthesis protein [Rhodobacteraceae bacterium]|nr:capsular biosynthesis protein [Paracoccaceae bacterium]